MIKFEVHYPTHSYGEAWEALPDLHCPACGQKEVWHSAGGGDLEIGEEHLCLACGVSFYIPCMYTHEFGRASHQYRQRMAQLRDDVDEYNATLIEMGLGSAMPRRPPVEDGLVSPEYARRFLTKMLRAPTLLLSKLGRRP